MIHNIVINKKQIQENNQISIIQKYLDFCDEQMENRTVWYLIPLITLSGAFLPASFVLMSYFDWYIGFVGLTILLFFANIIINIAAQHTKVTVTVYLFTVLFCVLSPIISFLIFGI